MMKCPSIDHVIVRGTAPPVGLRVSHTSPPRPGSRAVGLGGFAAPVKQLFVKYISFRSCGIEGKKKKITRQLPTTILRQTRILHPPRCDRGLSVTAAYCPAALSGLVSKLDGNMYVF